MSQSDRSLNVVRKSEIEIDLRKLLNILKKWSKLIVAGTLLCALLVGILSYFVLPPVYEAQTLLMVTQATEKLQDIRQEEDFEGVVSNVARIPVWTMNTYLGQIKSEALMKRVITRLKLDDEYSAANLSGMIEATIVKDSNLIDLRVSNGDSRLAAMIANSLSEEYMQFMSEKNREQISRSMKFMEEEKTKNDGELQKALQALKDLQSQPRGVLVLEAEFNSGTQDMVTFGSRLKAVRMEIRQLEAGINRMEQELDLIPEQTYTSEMTASEIGQLAETELNPDYSSLSQMLASKKVALAEKQGEAEGLQALMGSISGELDALQAELSEKRMAEEMLKREVERLQKTSQTLAEKGAEAQIARSLNLGDTSVVVLSEAFAADQPIKPNKKLNISIAIIMGLLVFILLSFVLEYLDNTLKTTEDINRELGMPVLGVIPIITGSNNRKTRFGGKL